MLITFEGIDGSGKTTHFKNLQEYLMEQGIKVKTFREPGGTQLSEKIRDILLDSDVDINDMSELLLFEASRSDLIEKQIKPALAEGYWVVLDRFFDSTMAYQGYGRGIQTEYVNYLNKLVAKGLEPDITFYMRISLEESIRRINKHNRSQDRIEMADKGFFERVYNGFEQAAKDNGHRTIIIDAMEEKHIVFATIIEYLKERGLK